jgi:hypothetical protein
MLPPNDVDYLQARAPDHTVSNEAGMTCVLLPAFPLPEGLDHPQSDLLLRLSPGYPDVPPDMWWFNPPICLRNGGEIVATQVRERHLGRDWQRWSRHLSAGQWRSGVDSLESYLALVRRELDAAASKVVV